MLALASDAAVGMNFLHQVCYDHNPYLPLCFTMGGTGCSTKSDAAVGMNFLHQSRIIHRDLKSGNMLVTQGFRVKICDFGISRSVDQQQTNMTG